MSEDNKLATPHQLPKLQDLYEGASIEVRSKMNDLNILLNQEPKKEWIAYHPTVKVKDSQGNTVPLQFIPIEKVEYLLTAIFGTWWVEIKSVSLIANSVVVVVRLNVIDPVTGTNRFQEGVGACPIQIKANSGGAIDFANMQSGAIQMGSPSAESYAISDAADKFGKIFGKDLNRKNSMNYMGMLASQFNTLPSLPKATIDKIIEQGKTDINIALKFLEKPFDEAQKQQIRKALNIPDHE